MLLDAGDVTRPHAGFCAIGSSQSAGHDDRCVQRPTGSRGTRPGRTGPDLTRRDPTGGRSPDRGKALFGVVDVFPRYELVPSGGGAAAADGPPSSFTTRVVPRFRVSGLRPRFHRRRPDPRTRRSSRCRVAVGGGGIGSSPLTDSLFCIIITDCPRPRSCPVVCLDASPADARPFHTVSNEEGRTVPSTGIRRRSAVYVHGMPRGASRFRTDQSAADPARGLNRGLSRWATGSVQPTSHVQRPAMRLERLNRRSTNDE
jgi:hypothetical protein